MREIKFRAWNHISKIMVYLDPFQWPMATLVDQSWRSIMQYTGLKDRNGKEIFEGDIIQFDKYEWYRSPVKTKEDIDKLPVIREEITMDWQGVSRSKNDLENYCEVIGNIYQHPELLARGKE